LEPWLYHLDSILAHLLCTLAVYGFVKVLTGRTVAAAVAGMLFGLHPMHIESIAWVAGRKDLLYGFFFVLACITHLYYRRTENKKVLWYAVTLILYFLSLLCKSVAVTLPVTLLLLDYFEERDEWARLLREDRGALGKFLGIRIAEKIPHFVLSLLFGYISVYTQKDIGALGTLDVNFTPIERFAIGCYGLVQYLWKAVIPAGLSNFYPYPMKVDGALPAVYYVFPAIVLGLIAAIWFFGRKNRIVILGSLFFFVNIVLLLQFIPVGGAVMSDRYSYIPYLGLFLIAGWYVSKFFVVPEKVQTGKMVLGAVIVYSLVLGYLSNQRCKDWYDSVSLWEDNIKKHPESPIAYFYLGQEYYTRFESATNQKDQKAFGDSAFYYFNQSIARKPDYINPIVCIGEYQRATGQIDAAKQTYLKGLQIEPKNESIQLGLGVVFAIKGQYDSADYAFRKAVTLKKYFPEAHANYANFLDIVGKTDSSLKEYAVAIGQNPDAYIPYMNRGRIYIRLGKWDEAIADYNKAIMLKPEMGEPYYQRGRCLAQKGNKAQALQDVQTAIAKGYTQVDQAFLQQLKG
jgi:tetratricopeptide (TPR) repeat protein